ncbi:MAG: hypothetical protein PWQ57_400 [Desulfovibrionales bacterium]|jgi:hypothetical protein|nr:hypothetical protein [Desulfovibrionales bacterium]
MRCEQIIAEQSNFFKVELLSSEQGAIMAETVEDLTMQYEEDGVVVVKELDKVVLSKGAWATVLFRYEQLDRRSGDYKEAYSIRRYQKSGGEYRQKSKFNISSRKQAQQLVEALGQWIED